MDLFSEKRCEIPALEQRLRPAAEQMSRLLQFRIDERSHVCLRCANATGDR